MIKKLQLDLLMYIPMRFYTSFGIIKLISQISQISRDIHAYNIAPRDILKVRYLLHPSGGKGLSALTVGISNVDKVEANDIVASVTTSRFGFV